MSLQDGNSIRFLHGYIVISGVISCRSGLLIGGADDTLQIGGIDKSVIRNPLTGEPYIPGSSLKGKLRSITEKIVTDTHNRPLRANRPSDPDKKVWRHECNDYNDAKACQLCRIFGATGKDNLDNYPGALLVRDSPLSKTKEMKQDGLPITETKMEIAIDRLTSAPQLRTFERVPAGAKFEFELVYRVETLQPEGVSEDGKVTVDSARVKTDITNLLNAMDILEKDGLGGSISRGYGRVEFKVKQFQSNEKDGFQDNDGKPLSCCKEKLNEIVFIKE